MGALLVDPVNEAKLASPVGAAASASDAMAVDEAKLASAAGAAASASVVAVELPSTAVFLRPKLKVRLVRTGPRCYAPLYDPYNNAPVASAAAAAAPPPKPASEGASSSGEPDRNAPGGAEAAAASAATAAATAAGAGAAAPLLFPPPAAGESVRRPKGGAASPRRAPLPLPIAPRQTRGAAAAAGDGGEKPTSSAVAYYRAIRAEGDDEGVGRGSGSPPPEDAAAAPPPPPRTLDARLCVRARDAAAAIAAARGGARRIELFCATGGGVVAAFAALRGGHSRVAVHLAPAGASWKLGPYEREALRVDVALARSQGAAGVVVGPVAEDGSLDFDLIARLVAAARPTRVAVCRAAFDASPDRVNSLQRLAAIGVDAVYSAGAAASAWEGRAHLSELAAAASDARVALVVDGGVAAGGVRALAAATGAPYFLLGDY